MRGMLFLPFCLCCETLCVGPANCCRLCVVRRMCCLASIQRRDGPSIQIRRAINLLFDALNARARRGNQAAGDRLAETTVLFLQSNPRPIFHRVSARLSLRGPPQNLLGCLLRSHKRRYRNRQLRRNEPYLHARRIQRRFMIPSQAIVVLRGAGHVLGPESW